mmetsp:Transcript_10470/g.26222  ORF Transcript_10470/g.26222 Transcript_10470/m.26222 type:complete len:524 (+) Transcript_10470:348-1919(+)
MKKVIVGRYCGTGEETEGPGGHGARGPAPAAAAKLSNVADFVRSGQVQIGPGELGGLQLAAAGTGAMGAADQAGVQKALAALDKVQHLGAPQLLSDVATLTRRQMRSFLTSLGCEKVSWKCDMLRRQCKAVIECKAKGINDYQALKKAAEDAHFTPRQERIQTINKIQKSFEEARKRELSGNFHAARPKAPRSYLHGSGSTSSGGASGSSAAQMPVLQGLKWTMPQNQNQNSGGGNGNTSNSNLSGAKNLSGSGSADPRDSIMADIAGTVTRTQMRSMLTTLGVEKVSWKCNVLRKQIKAVLEAQESPEDVNLREVAENVAEDDASADLSRRESPVAGKRIRQVIGPHGSGGAGVATATMAPSPVQRSALKCARLLGNIQHGLSLRQGQDNASITAASATAAAAAKESILQNTLAKIPTTPPSQSWKHLQGVTHNRATGQFEAHLYEWYDSPEGKKGRQVFLGSFPTERAAARGHDIAVLRHNRDKVVSLAQLKDPRTKKSIQEVFGLNYPFEEYEGTDAVLK